MAPLLSLMVAITKGDLIVCELLQSTVGDGYPKDVTGQVVEGLFCAAGVPAVDVPFLIPTRAVRVQQSDLFEARFDLGAEDPTQRISRNQEVGMLGVDPSSLGADPP